MGKYLAFDADNREYEESETIEEARDYCQEGFLSEDGYSQETSNYKIYTLTETVELKVIAEKKDFTDEEWSEKGYRDEFDEICQHEFIKVE